MITDPTNPKLGAKGMCFYNSLQLLERLQTKDPAGSFYLAHGLPTLQRPPHCKFAHAWVEQHIKVPVQAFGDFLEMIIIYDHRAERSFQKQRYYQSGKIDPNKVVLYNLRSAYDLSLETGNYGPWDETILKEGNFAG